MKNMITFGAIAAMTSIALGGPGDIAGGVFYGSGNGNGSFTTASSGNLEIGLRAHVRYNSAGAPESTYNWDGVDTYTFNPADGNPPANRAMWNFDFSVNTDVDGMTGGTVSDFTYELAMFKVGADGTNNADALVFDPFTGPDPRHGLTYYDHSFGDNGTTQSTDFVAGDLLSYGSALSTYSIAQNSWNYGFYNGAGTGVLQGMDPSASGTYIVRLIAYDLMGVEVASTDIYINVVPVPTAAFAGLGLLGALGGVRVLRRR